MKFLINLHFFNVVFLLHYCSQQIFLCTPIYSVMKTTVYSLFFFFLHKMLTSASCFVSISHKCANKFVWPQFFIILLLLLLLSVSLYTPLPIFFVMPIVFAWNLKIRCFSTKSHKNLELFLFTCHLCSKVK